jgi:hypothetical protein
MVHSAQYYDTNLQRKTALWGENLTFGENGLVCKLWCFAMCTRGKDYLKCHFEEWCNFFSNFGLLLMQAGCPAGSKNEEMVFTYRSPYARSIRNGVLLYCV